MGASGAVGVAWAPNESPRIFIHHDEKADTGYNSSSPGCDWLVRDIARDAAVWEPWREHAARILRFLHFGRGSVTPGVDPPVDFPGVDAVRRSRQGGAVRPGRGRSASGA